jgi:hypothetical protein
LGRLTIFAKGNLDVRDSLHSLRVGGEVRWNGINEVVRERYAATTVRLRHETATRSDALLAADSKVPPELAGRSLPLGAYPAASQFSAALFEAAADAFVLSIQPDVASTLVRHRRDGYLFYPEGWRAWPEADRRWLHDGFDFVDLLDAETSMGNLGVAIARIRARSTAPILVYNLSAVVPGDSVHCHAGLGDTLSTRIRRFNLGLAELSQRTGISIVDVDGIVARTGADRSKLDAFHLTADGCRLVAAEVVRVLDELGCLPATAPLRC